MRLDPSAQARCGLLGALAFLCAWTIAGMQIAGAVLLATFLLGADFRSPSPFRAPVLAFAGWCLLTVLLSPATVGSFLPTAWLPVLLVWVVAAFAAPLSEARLRQVAVAWVVATTITSAFSLLQAYTGFDLLHLLHVRVVPVDVDLESWPGHHAATGFFTSRLTYAHALLVPLGVSAAWALKESGRKQALALAATLLMTAGLVLSFARAAWWGAVVLAVLLVFTTRARRAALLGGAAALVLATAVPSVRARFASSVSLARNSDRVFIWDRAREVITDYPILGVGFGAYPQVAGPYYDRASPIFPMRTWCHDTPLSLLAETGPLGLLLYLLLWSAVYGFGLRAVRRGSTLALGLLGGTLALQVASLFHDILYNAEVAYALYLGGGLLATLGVKESEVAGGFLEVAQDAGRALLLGALRVVYPLSPPAAPVVAATLRKVLVVRVDTRVGNVLLTTPLLRALRQGMPQAQIEVLVAARNAALIEGLVHRVIPFAKEDFFRSPLRFWRRLFALRAERYDAIVEAGHWHAFSFTSLWLTRFIGAPVRIGHARGEAARFLTHPVGKDPAIVREVPAKLELLAPLGIAPAGEQLETTVDRAHASAPFTWAAERRPVTLNPGARKADHRWAPEAFGALAAQLHDHLQADPIVLWGPGEEAIAAAVVAASGGKARLGPSTDLAELAAAFRRSALVITNDTGPMHLAVATGAPVVAILLAEDGARWSHAGRFRGVMVRGSETREPFAASAELLGGDSPTHP